MRISDCLSHTQMDTHRVRLHGTRLPQDTHRRVQVRLERGADGHRDITEARQDGDLDVAVEDVALQVLEEHVHERARVLRGLITQRA